MEAGRSGGWIFCIGANENWICGAVKKAVNAKLTKAVGLALLCASRAGAYQANCGASGPSPVSNATIISAFGEPRPVSTVTVSNVRFHSGVDIGECNAGKEVYPILAGTREIPTVCSNAITITCLRIRDSANHAFDYEHLAVDASLPSTGSYIAAGTLLGEVLSSNTLHLQEAYGIKGAAYATAYRVNPLRVGALDFNHSNLPKFTQTSINGAIDQSVILMPAYTGIDPKGLQPNPTAFRNRSSKYYVRGKADVLVAGSGGQSRKGVYVAGYALSPPAKRRYDYNITFNQLVDNITIPDDFWNVYLSSNPTGITHIVSNMKLNGQPFMETGISNWDTTDNYPEGNALVCGIIMDFPQGHTATPICVNAYVDNTPPATPTFTSAGVDFTVATATPVVTVTATDPGGVYSITLTGPSYSSTTYPSGVQTTASNQFPDSPATLLDGSYSVSVQDLSGNESSSALFTVSTVKPACGSIQDIFRNAMTSVIPSTIAPVFQTTGSIAGVQSIKLQDPSGVQIGISEFANSIDAVAGPYPNLSTGTYTLTVTDAANNICQSTFSIVNATASATSCLSGGDGNCDTETVTGTGDKNSVLRLLLVTLEPAFDCIPTFPATLSIPNVIISSAQPWAPDASCIPLALPSTTTGSCYKLYTCELSAHDVTYTISTNSGQGFGLSAFASVVSSTGATLVSLVSTAPTPGWTVIYGSITVPQFGGTEVVVSTDGALRLASYFSGVTITSETLSPSEELAYLQHVLGRLGNPYVVLGSDFVFTSTTAISLSTTIPAGVVADTSTIRIYRHDGTSWSSATVINQYVSITSGVVTATGAVTLSGMYSLLFTGVDTTPPASFFSVAGTTYIFDGSMFVSTDSYIVLTASDPIVNGYASHVSSITYRLDPQEGDSFLIYSSSLPVSLGTHILEYRSIDYAGNVEAVRTATFTVTAGSAFKNTSDHRVNGALLAGFLGSGAQAEVVSAAENNYTLMVSSANRSQMLAVSNIGGVAVGSQTPQGRLDLGQSDVALLLRSGNSTSTGTALQMTFGYNGDYAMRHALRTRHSTAADGNRMDFLLWSPAAGATTTVASVNVLSLQGISSANDGSFHVMPFGEPDAEVEVSNGSSLGGGTIQRLQVLTPSSRRFKSDIRYLNARQEDAALDAIAGMRHARFRYKSRDARPQPLNVGLIYEEAPETIRAAEKTLSTVERVAEVEMALKAALRQLEALDKRHAELKSRRRTP